MAETNPAAGVDKQSRSPVLQAQLSPRQNDSTLHQNADATTDSLDLDDARRIWTDGKEEELRLLCGKLILRTEELSRLITTYQLTQTELETSLTLTRSNLTLAMANTEMLEEALKRSGSQSANKDVGWRRWSDREGLQRTTSLRGSGVRERENRESTEGETGLGDAGLMPSPPLTRGGSSESRFFKFRFGAAVAPASPGLQGSSSPVPPPTPQNTASSRPSSPAPGHNKSSSSTSGIHSSIASPPRPTRKELELTSMLAREREALIAAQNDKSALEDEIENLSAALFEEANKMVATERRRLAHVEEELRLVREQKLALQGALKIIESENQSLREEPSVPPLRSNSLDPALNHDDSPPSRPDAPTPAAMLLESQPVLSTPPSSQTPKITARSVPDPPSEPLEHKREIPTDMRPDLRADVPVFALR